MIGLEGQRPLRCSDVRHKLRPPLIASTSFAKLKIRFPRADEEEGEIMAARRAHAWWLGSDDIRHWRAIETKVVSGKGTAGTKAPEPDAKRQEILEVSGIDKVPGSLNLHCLQRLWLRRRSGIPWSRGLMYPGRIAGIDVVFSTSSKLAARPRLIHVYAGKHLRTELSIRTGELVSLLIPKEVISPFPLLYDIVYSARLLRWSLAKKLRGMPS